jgi:hypothetical protein
MVAAEQPDALGVLDLGEAGKAPWARDKWSKIEVCKWQYLALEKRANMGA